MKLRLWVSIEEGEDMDLFFYIDKVDSNGDILPVTVLGHPLKLRSGRLRVSQRKIDDQLSTSHQIVLAHTEEKLLSPGEIVPVEISLRPLGMYFKENQQILFTISGYEKTERHIPGLEKPKTRNKGRHLIHTGGKFDSYLQVPVV